MKVYFTSSTEGSDLFSEEISEIIRALKDAKVELLLTWKKFQHLGGDTYKSAEADPEKIFKENTEAIGKSDLAIFETSVPSWGLGYQVAVAITSGIPALCLYKESASSEVESNLISGVRSPILTYKAYGDLSDIEAILDEFINSSKSRELVKFNFIITQELKDLINTRARSSGVSTSKFLRDFLYQHMYKL